MPADVELVDVTNFPVPVEPTAASVSYVLAHETSRELEVRGEFCRAAELLAIALAEEAQRDNQRALQTLDLSTDPESFKATTIAMAGQRQLAHRLLVPLLDERAPALLGGCLQTLLAHRVPRQPLPRPAMALGAIAKRWHLPIERVSDEYWPDFVRASGGAYTLSLARAKQTILEGASDEVALATWRFVLTDASAAELIVFGADDDDAAEEPSMRLRSTSNLYSKPPPSSAGEPSAPTPAPAEGGASTSSKPEGVAEAVRAAVESAISVVVDAATGGAADAEAHGNGQDGVGGGSGMSFEEYVVLRGFVEAESLEEQFRFLWRLLDDDGDGMLSADDLRQSLRLPAVRLGWSDLALGKWAAWAYEQLKVRDKQGRVGAPELRAALRKSTALRTILMAKEPAGGAMARQPSSTSPVAKGWLEWLQD